MKHTLKLSLPTFSELCQMLSKQGLTEAMQDDGTIVLGELEISSSSDVLQTARIAAGIAQQLSHPEDPTLVYRDEKITIRRRCEPAGVRLEVLDGTAWGSGEVMIPRHALHLVAGELIDCMGKKE